MSIRFFNPHVGLNSKNSRFLTLARYLERGVEKRLARRIFANNGKKNCEKFEKNLERN